MTPLEIPRGPDGGAEIRFRLIRNTGIVSWVIRRRTNSAFGHGEVEDAQGWWIGAQPFGVARMRPDYVTPEFELRVAIPVGEATARAFYDFIGAQIGKPYDWGAIVRLAAGLAANLTSSTSRRNWRDPAQWFCFELVMGALEWSGLTQLPIELPIVAITGNELVVAASAGPVRFTALPLRARAARDAAVHPVFPLF